MNDNGLPYTPDARGIGDNAPPDEAALLIERTDNLVKAADAWREIDSAEQAAKLGDYIQQLRDAGVDLEKAEDTLKRPHMTALEIIRGKFRRSRGGVQSALIFARGLADGWLNREKRRLGLEKAAADLAADRARRDAEAALVAAQESGRVGAEIAAREAMAEALALSQAAEGTVTRATIRSELGGRAIGQTTRWSAEISDPKKAHAFFLKNPEAVAAFDKAILVIARKLAVALKDQKKAPPGITFTQRTSA
jgi:hypothetical protein